MVDSYLINLEGIGPVTLERSLRARRIVVSVRPFRGVRVAVPSRESFKNAEKFLFSRKDWVKRHLEKIQKYEKECQASQAVPDDIDIIAAKRALASRLKQLADERGFKYGRLSVRKQRTRWGSCSAGNNISLNARLTKLSPELMDYVILHELVHTRVHNHSKKFWAELDRHVGNGRLLAKKLRTNGLELT